MTRARTLAAGAFLLSASVPALACPFHGGWGFDHGFGAAPHHFAEDWAPAPPVAALPVAADASPATRMERQRELMLARYPALRPMAEGTPATPQPDGAASPEDR